MNERDIMMAMRDVMIATAGLPIAALMFAAPFGVVAVVLWLSRSRLGRWLCIIDGHIPFAWTIALMVSMLRAFGLG